MGAFEGVIRKGVVERLSIKLDDVCPTPLVIRVATPAV
jgi:hypothetical protein